jgi:hypothetical protein
VSSSTRPPGIEVTEQLVELLKVAGVGAIPAIMGATSDKDVRTMFASST